MTDSNTYMKIQNLVSELESYTQYEMDELQEACDLLISLSRYPDYVSDEFYDALCKEIVEQLNNYQENTEIVRTTETITREVVGLEWK